MATREKHMLICPKCKEQFLTYQVGGLARCPRCGASVREGRAMKLIRLLAVAILAAAIAAAAYFYLRSNGG